MNAETRLNALAVESVRARLNPTLRDASQFQAFAADPVAFAQRNGLKLDPELLSTLKARLAGVACYDDAQKFERPMPLMAISNPATANEKPSPRRS